MDAEIEGEYHDIESTVHERNVDGTLTVMNSAHNPLQRIKV